uniref:Uncharacterized protein n=1 Tax=Nonomuraea gerenzanensis TaxID=93944 RepID=A0A1M4E5F1_9ACTN|nr:hypothetical protein BN4615_P3504 [Nonomuraea gerenzanensis]
MTITRDLLIDGKSVPARSAAPPGTPAWITPAARQARHPF